MYPRVECAWSHPQIQSPPDESQGNGTKPDKQVRSWQRQHVRPPNLSQPQKVGRQWLRRAKPLKGSAPHPLCHQKESSWEGDRRYAPSAVVSLPSFLLFCFSIYKQVDVAGAPPNPCDSTASAEEEQGSPPDSPALSLLMKRIRSSPPQPLYVHTMKARCRAQAHTHSHQKV